MNSCRYYSFFFLYYYGIYRYIKNNNQKYQNIIYKMINNIANILIKADSIKLKNGIWSVLEENKIKECY